MTSRSVWWWYHWYFDQAQLARRVGDRAEAAWALAQAGDARRWIMQDLNLPLSSVQ